MQTALRVVRCAACQSNTLVLLGWQDAASSASGILPLPQASDTSDEDTGHPRTPGRPRALDNCIAVGDGPLTRGHRRSAHSCAARNSGGRLVSSSTPFAQQYRFSTTRNRLSGPGAGNAAAAPAPAAAAIGFFSTESRPNTDADDATATWPPEQRQQLQWTSPAAPPQPQALPQRPTAAELLGSMLKDKPFTVAQLPGRGRGLVAVGFIPRGQVVHREVPLVAFPELGATHGVCYHCLAPLALTNTGPVRHSGPNRRRFCCDSCMNTAREQYLEVEEAAAAASRGSGGGGGKGGPLAQLYEQCRQHGERFPLMAARLAFMEVSEAVRQCLGGMRTPARNKALVSEQQLDRHGNVSSGVGCIPAKSPPGTSSDAPPPPPPPATRDDAHAHVSKAQSSAPTTAAAAASATAVSRDDPLRSLHVLCFANVALPYPDPWVEQYGLLAAALRGLAAHPAALRNLAVPMAASAASRSQRAGAAAAGNCEEDKSSTGAATDVDMRMKADLDTESVVNALSRVVATLVSERLSVEWFVGVMARLHLNVFQVHNPLAGADPADLAATAAALVSGSAGGGSSGSAVYLVASLFNHSCEPTLELSFPDLEAAACFVAARDIAPGEELCVSYLDVGLPYNVRRQHLEWSYGFVCGCARCREEAAEAGQARGDDD